MLKLAVGASLAASALADIKLSRTVDTLAAGNSFEILVSPGCAATDQYGSNDCDFHWGQDISGTLKADLGQPLDASAKLSFDLKLNSFIPFKGECALCGGTCAIKIPIVEKEIDIPLPDCPIAAAGVSQPISFTLPDKSPLPLDVKVKGSVSVTSGGTTLAKITLNAELGQNRFHFEAEEEEVARPMLGANGHGVAPSTSKTMLGENGAGLAPSTSKTMLGENGAGLAPSASKTMLGENGAGLAPNLSSPPLMGAGDHDYQSHQNYEKKSFDKLKRHYTEEDWAPHGFDTHERVLPAEALAIYNKEHNIEAYESHFSMSPVEEKYILEHAV